MRLGLTMVFCGLSVVSAAGRTLSARELVDEIGDSRMILRELFGEVSQSLKGTMESGNPGRVEQSLARYVRTLDEHLAAFETLVDASPAERALRLYFIAFLQWQRAELPGRIEAVVVVGRKPSLDPVRRRAAIQELMEPFVKKERQWLKQLEEMGSNALLQQSAIPGGEIERRSRLRTLAGLLMALFLSMVGVAGGIWIFLKGARRNSPGKVMPEQETGKETPGDSR